MDRLKKTSQKDSAGSDMALKILNFIAIDDDRLLRFCSLSGLGIDDFRNGISDTTFQAMIFDQALQDEDLMVAFAAEHQLTPELIAKARRALPGSHDF
jgi:hypothetical protein